MIRRWLRLVVHTLTNTHDARGVITTERVENHRRVWIKLHCPICGRNITWRLA